MKSHAVLLHSLGVTFPSAFSSLSTLAVAAPLSGWFPQTLKNKKIGCAWLDQRDISSGVMLLKDVMIRSWFPWVRCTSCSPGVLILVISSYGAPPFLHLKTKASSCCCQTLTQPQSKRHNGYNLWRSIWRTGAALL